MRIPDRLHALPSLPVLAFAVAAGVIEWAALWRSRHRLRAAASLRA